MEQLLTQHKKEQRDLVSRITGLKKQATKKNRKSVLSQCEQLQNDLDTKQKREIEELNGTAPEKDDDVSPEALLASMSLEEASKPVSESSEPSSNPKTKRNRAKERLQKRQEQLDAMRSQALEEAAGETDYRAIEQESMGKVLAANGLAAWAIKPDGHCLFASIQDQLKQRSGVEVSIEKLREEAAEYVRKHRDEFVPFLFDEQTMSLRDVDEYTRELETTAMWGSDMEIIALARRYGVVIKVFSAGSAPIMFNEDLQGLEDREDEEEDKEEGSLPEPGTMLYLAFYKHNYGLGEHYDSCRDAA
ncbi:hypothetical protein FT663_05383 [Candidozyma haemuli var. vulneris]|uniref:OTU domain-containing protein n=1 Tax=Candidozyma haemuli TaxID=45357 RepID=A0A2V1AQD8_9ASCO|nr:hypothetical protein CXQ85_001482 [[Candida] haemuloni]KAF3985042.1 hypothetical protein FT662_05392 [[Candida] haemuloni var. vulneris]KAF3985215.1 hypothetical protein FT663_05383 [[Candida] haemuloni var. vulneris]PVH19181.1 hypothetical protein CXQ85_001482 [[Candida] haemuloni]